MIGRKEGRGEEKGIFKREERTHVGTVGDVAIGNVCDELGSLLSGLEWSDGG